MATLDLDGEIVGMASADGWFFVGFDRDAPLTQVLTVTTSDGSASQALAIAPGDFDIQQINGLAADQVAPEDPLLLARIAAEGERKAKGFSSLADLDAFKDGFIMPVVRARRSARFGGQRILNGEPRRPHFGVDLAAPVGTPVRAPAGGQVSFAETGLHFEGGLVLIDHGQGLITAYLHLSKVIVMAGDLVTQGQEIGAVGREGRATGPHLCWRMKWRGRNLDPSLMVDLRRPRL